MPVRISIYLILAAFAGLIWYKFQRPQTASPKPQPIHKALVPGRGVPPDIVERFKALEIQARQADSTVWAPERLAEAYEEVWIQLWDRLRASDDRMGDAASFQFGKLRIPALKPASDLAHGIKRWEGVQPDQELSPHEWRSRILRLQKEGWVIDGLEIRMPEFHPPSATVGASGRLDVEVHLLTSEPMRRAIARGSVRVKWATPDTPDTRKRIPEIREIQLESLDILTRFGSPPFVPVVRESLHPHQGMMNIDPLMVLDVDGDSRDDICLAGRNLLYRNLADGFRQEILFPALDTVILAGIAGDFNADGNLDFIGADSTGLVMFRGDGSGRFSVAPQHQFVGRLENPWVMTSGDVDSDGDLDLWLGQYKQPYLKGQMPVPYHDANDGFPSFLLLNDGQGNFSDATVGSGLEKKRFRRCYSGSWVDLDLDGDLDLIVVSDFAGVDYHRNVSVRGQKPRFEDASALLGTTKLFGMGHVIADLDGNNRPDLVAIGMNSPVADRLNSMNLGTTGENSPGGIRAEMTYGNRTWLGVGPDRFETPSWARRIARTGWSWGACIEDLDNDGNLDFYVVNGHRSMASAREYDCQFWTHDIHGPVSTNLDPALSLFFESRAGRFYGAGMSYGGHQRNQFLLRRPDSNFDEVGWLMGLALPEDCRNVVASDLDLDGRLDLVVTGIDFGSNPANHLLMILKNGFPDTRSATIRLPMGSGAEYAGTSVEVSFQDGSRRSYWPVTGGSYRSQSPQKIHVGLGKGARPNGIVRAMRGPRELPILIH